MAPCRYLFCIVLISCNKHSDEIAVNPPVNPVTDSVLIKKINTWMDAQTDEAVKTESKQTVQLVKKNLNFRNLEIQELKDGKKFVVVPLLTGFVSKTNKDKSPVNRVLFQLKENGEIEKGNIVQYIPNNKPASAPVPEKLFKRVFNYEPLQGSFRLTFLSVEDGLLFEIRVKDGKPVSMSVTDQKKKTDVGGRNQTEQCYDVYWVEFFDNGNTVWSYMYSYCEDACNSTREAAGRGFVADCAGGSSGAIEYEMQFTRDVSWEVFHNPSGASGGIMSLERLKGRRLSTNPQGGEFKSTSSHFWSICNFCSADHDEVWVEHSGTVVAAGQNASSTVSGYLRFENREYPNISNSKGWRFDEIF